MKTRRNLYLVFLAMLIASIVSQAQDRPERIGYHAAVYDAAGKLLPWTSWKDALDREMKWYESAPTDAHGYPAFVPATFLTQDWKCPREDCIPCTQNGMGILSYLKYWEYTGKKNTKTLETAKKMGDYLITETLTPNKGAYPRFTRSTGFSNEFPLTKSAQKDWRYGKNVIEPDKGGIAGYALLKLYEATQDKRYLKQAKHNADLLAKNMRVGDAAHAPFPFRVDSVTGKHFAERSANMTYILRLFDALIAQGDKKYTAPREALWKWIKNYEIPSPDDPAKSLWVHFHEDYDLEGNRNSWSPLETARYLIERKESLDPDWRADAQKLIQFALKNFSSPRPGGVTVMGEQDDDHDPWGGTCSKLGGVCAMFFAAGGGEAYKEIAVRNITWMMYFIDDNGCSAQKDDGVNPRHGGWQEDSHTDVVHNFVDALVAIPEFADSPK